MGDNNLKDKTGEDGGSPVSSSYPVLELLKYPACIIGVDSTLVYANAPFRRLFDADTSIHLDVTHPFFPEYRKNIAVAYTKALTGSEKRCFAVMASAGGKRLPVEIQLIPMFSNGSVSSLLAFLKPVEDNRLTSFDSSTSALVEPDENQVLTSIMEFAPFPIIRINDQGNIVNGSASVESFFGFSLDEMKENRNFLFRSVNLYDFERMRKAITDIITGQAAFKRLGELRIVTRNREEKWANAIIFPVIVSRSIEAADLIIEDITRVKSLENRLSTLNRIQIVGDLTKGLLHSFNNMINVIMSRTQLLLQVTEKDIVTEGLRVIEKTAGETVKQIRRIQDFIGEGENLREHELEDLIDVIEDAIEFSKIHFKVETKERRRQVKIERRYFCLVNVQTDTRILREIIVSMIFKVSSHLKSQGTINLMLKSNGTPVISAHVKKDTGDTEPGSPVLGGIVFSDIDIHRIAEKLNVKIIEEESSDSYSVKAILPQPMIISKVRGEPEVMEFKIRDLDILIVEDEPALKEILFELFDSMGNRVTLCDSGDEALSAYKNGNFNLVLTDYGTRGLTGLELAARVKEIDEKTVTVLMSGWMLTDLKAYKNVVDLFMPKPFQLDSLIKGISKIFQSRER
ncbi:MAG TPA: response regulator [Spirochaetes bacterium]|nr:response regulator [Spirochaetota bacterium]